MATLPPVARPAGIREIGHLPLWPLYCDAQSVQLIKENLVDRSSLSVREDNGLSKQISSRPLELAKDSEGDFLTARQRFQLCLPRRLGDSRPKKPPGRLVFLLQKSL